MDILEKTQRLPSFISTAVGSIPHTRVEEGVELIFDSLPTAPHAPQLSRADPREQMWIQFTEGLPGFRVDLTNLNYYFDTSEDSVSQAEKFFASYLDVMEGGPVEDFAVGPDYGAGIHYFLDKVRTSGRKWPVLKVQVTGPLSFALTVTDENKKPIFYHPLFKDVAVKAMGLKAVWLLEQVKPFAENVIVFFDEPIMSAYGSSAYLGVSRTDVIEAINDVVSMVLDRGGIPGVHCCGNTDWGILMDTATTIINFDAVDYMDTMAIYSSGLEQFLGRGGILAWGVVPNTPSVVEESLSQVVARLRTGVQLLVGSGVDPELLRRGMLVTPACGCAGLTLSETAKVYRLLAELDEQGEAIISEAFQQSSVSH
ncbi:hypothetical protein ACFL2Q_07510 [Thermodesulfobacteriota bacterium]